jgi:hypothetical protein
MLNAHEYFDAVSETPADLVPVMFELRIKEPPVITLNWQNHVHAVTAGP